MKHLKNERNAVVNSIKVFFVIHKRNGVTVNQISEITGFSKRNIYRYIQFLERSDLPLYADKESIPNQNAKANVWRVLK